jgi:hypothetical protein
MKVSDKAAIVFALALVMACSDGSDQVNLADCATPGPNEPMLVTDACVDTHFGEPYIDIDELRDSPAPHRYIHGGFGGTDTRFSFYFPPTEQFEGRFFQHTHQLLSSEDSASDTTIGFALASGGYYVQSNIGGSERATTAEQAITGDLDPSIGGYRANAAAARYSRAVAQDIYGDGRIYGYLYGGSGGAYQTICSAEHTLGIWDGFVPYVMGVPNAIPSNFTVRVHALRVLKQRNKFPEIVDAIEPGGSGNPYAGLNEEEAGALREATRMGYPLRGWWNHETLNGGALGLVAGYVPLLDPTYQNDYWGLPGYLGHDDPTGSVAAARIQDAPGARTVTAVNELSFPGLDISLAMITLDSLPPVDLLGAELSVDLGGGQTEKAPILFTLGNQLIPLGMDVSNITPGMPARVDNSEYLALQTYHRHQLPTPDMYGFNSLRGPDGEPRYPQRDVLTGPVGAFNGAGCIAGGNFNGTLIAVQSMLDIDAFPWNADWYRTKVMAALGQDFDSRYRLYFTDHAQHNPDPAADPASAITGPNLAALAHSINYTGVLEHALRDLSQWVENGTPAPQSTHYTVDADSQVVLPPTGRGGIQPVVQLSVNGGVRADIQTGSSVDFDASILVPEGGGELVKVEWDFLGTGAFPVSQNVSGAFDSVQASHTFAASGTFFPVVRVTTQREGNSDDAYARAQNLARVRVVVSN